MTVYPDDANGDVLRRREANGDDLNRSRDIDFTVSFPDQQAAEQFAKHMCAVGYRPSTDMTRTVEELPWDVVVVKHMVPIHCEIADFEDLLQRIAAPFGGRNDGWGCLSEPAGM